MNYNKKIWKIILSIYIRKKLLKNDIFSIYKNTNTLIPSIIWKKKKRYKKVYRKFFIHNGNKIIKKKVFSNKFPLNFLVKTVKLYDVNSEKARKKLMKKKLKNQPKKILIKKKIKTVVKFTPKKKNLKKLNAIDKIKKYLKVKFKKSNKKLIEK